ncbi:UDP-glycosyltransferase 85A5-like [Cryptomeria japonica]|uniref:UDP-glycosyltransferase 85A5-like n=1 Tax=Cryptomeria japonica TaxID=3369 RepID=UPI0025AC0942|nr:UDP-glycosyltransferase 85A5-like [Cryptomeria japonica]
MGRTLNKKPLAVMVPFPAQGHINPMFQLAKKLAVEEGFAVMFVNTDYQHERMVGANNNKESSLVREAQEIGIRLLSISDGLGPHESRNQFSKMVRSMEATCGPLLCKLVDEIQEEEGLAVTCLIVDLISAYWVLEATQHLDISRAVFWTGLTASYSTFYHAPTLISSGIITSEGTPTDHRMVEYVPWAPQIHSSQFPWLLPGSEDQEFLFLMTLRCIESAKGLFHFTNTVNELEIPIHKSFAKEDQVYSIGPLIPSQFLDAQSERTMGTMSTGFWTEEVECLSWLDKQLAKSVIYVAFGSVAILNQTQLEEFALGLEATQRPFLWVLRCDLLNGEPAVLPSGFMERTKHLGCFVSWSPQLRVLSHPSVACFVTHCGWNSTLESITMGVPMICWPYFADQFIDSSFILEEWRVGLTLNANMKGIIEKREVQEIVERLLDSKEGAEISEKMSTLKNMVRTAVREGGSSNINFRKFVNAMKNT